MTVLGVDSHFQITTGKKRIETQNFWAEFRVKRDKRRGDYYIDLLVGRRGHFLDHLKHYSHTGINSDQSLRFCEGRGVLTSMRREIDSKQRGRIADETIRFKPPERAGAEFKFQITIDEPTKTITPKFEEVTLKQSNA
jgi:hypothetical protein